MPTPRLCSDALLGARGAARLERLLRELFGGARSSGFVRASAEAGGARLALFNTPWEGVARSRRQAESP